MLFHECFSYISEGYKHGPNRMFKVGHSGELQRRLHDSSYTTLFGDSYQYMFTLETETKVDAEAVERKVLFIPSTVVAITGLRQFWDCLLRRSNESQWMRPAS